MAVGLVLAAGCAQPPQLVILHPAPAGHPAFTRTLEAHTLAGFVSGNRMTLLLNGDEIFPAMLSAIRAARNSITLANYIYEDGDIAREIGRALAERCRAGVEVSVLVDAVGSHRMEDGVSEALRGAGCRLERFHPVNPFEVRRVNHRNHRRVLVVDGRIAFSGGTGIGTKWTGNGRQPGHRRQTDIAVDGPLVRQVQAAFVDVWRETTGVMLAGDAYFPELAPQGAVTGQALRSSPLAGSVDAYALFLLSIESARTVLDLTTPYFVPDATMMGALVRAVSRGVRVSVLVSGDVDNMTDRIVRTASRKSFGAALEGGVRIYEYTGALLHAKTIAVDGVWGTVGSVNLDNRSFSLNHELNVTFHDATLARRLHEVFEADLRTAREVTLDAWKQRGLGRVLEWFLLPLRNQL